MPLFHYKLVDRSGKQTEGTAEAADKFALYHAIKKDGLTIVSTKELTGKDSVFSMNIKLPFFGSVKAQDKITFAKNLSKMIDAGLPVTRGLSIMERQAKGEFKKVLVDLNESLSRGTTFSDSMKAHPKVFSTLFISMVKAGEESGNLSQALKNVGLQMEKSNTLSRKIKGALIYPAVILSLMVVIGALMMIYMVPTLTATFIGLGVKLPLSTRIIIFISNFLKDYILYVILGIIALSFGGVMAFKTEKGQRTFDFVLLRTPIIGQITKEINSARTARTLSSLLSSGVDILVAIGVTKEVIQNSYYKEVLIQVEDTIQKGELISSVFSRSSFLYPLFVGEMIAVGEETGKIGEMLMSIASFYEDEVDQKTKDMTSVIEPFLMIFIGLAVGLFAISMLSPTYSLADAIN